MSFRLAWVSLASVLALSLVAAGCDDVNTSGQAVEEATPTPEGGDDDDDGGDPDPTPNPNQTPTPQPTQPVGSGNEVEPNDDHDAANFLGTSTTITGICGGDTDFFDIFKVSVPAGASVSASITWSEGGDDDLDLFVSSYDYLIDEGDEGIPPGDSPAQTAATFPAAQDAYIEVYCYYALNETPFTGTVTVQ